MGVEFFLYYDIYGKNWYGKNDMVKINTPKCSLDLKFNISMKYM